jgi:adenylate cyclase class 2
MGKEFEVKVINPNIDLFKKILKDNDGKLVHPQHKMFRHVYNHPDPKVDGFVRLRKEDENKTTLTSKIFNKSKFPLEYELTIDEPYEKGIEFMEKSGMNLKSYQETAREKWSHPLAKEIVFDSWPGIPEFIEIDCESEENLKHLIQLFNIDNRNIRYDGVDSLYEELYDIPKKNFNVIPKLTFQDYKSQISGGKKIKGKRTKKIFTRSKSTRRKSTRRKSTRKHR